MNFDILKQLNLPPPYNWIIPVVVIVITVLLATFKTWLDIRPHKRTEEQLTLLKLRCEILAIQKEHSLNLDRYNDILHPPMPIYSPLFYKLRHIAKALFWIAGMVVVLNFIGMIVLILALLVLTVVIVVQEGITGLFLLIPAAACGFYFFLIARTGNSLLSAYFRFEEYVEETKNDLTSKGKIQKT